MIEQPTNHRMSIMKICVAPASTKTGRAAIDALLKDTGQHSVVGIYRDLGKVPEHFKWNPWFEARQGDVASVETLNFSGCDVLLTMTPPFLFTSDDPVSTAKEISDNVREAVLRVGSIRRIVYISSMGAQHESGVVRRRCYFSPCFRFDTQADFCILTRFEGRGCNQPCC